MFEKDTRTPEQKQRESEQAEAIGRLIIGLLFLVVLPYLTLSALLGYLLLCAWRDKKYLGVAAVALITLPLIFYLVGFPQAVQMNNKGYLLETWPGTLFTDFGNYFGDFYKSIYGLFRWKTSLYSYWQFSKFARYLIWSVVPGGVIAWGIFHSQKKWEVKPGLYRLSKMPLDLWLRFVGDPSITIGSKLLMLVFQSATLWVLARIILPRLPGNFWTIHAFTFLAALGSVVAWSLPS